MDFNIDKCKVMHVGRRNARSSDEYTMTDANCMLKPLEVVNVERDLGVSDDLILVSQCSAVAANANWKFGVFKKTFASLDPRLWQFLWKTHIRLHVEHAIQAWSPYLKKDIDVLERVQR